jgi:hypothetical protein
MGELQFLGELVVAVAAMAGPIVVLTKWLAGHQGDDVGGATARPTGLSWPWGVQEEEPVRWNLRLLDRPRGRSQQMDTPRPRRHRPLPLTR